MMRSRRSVMVNGRSYRVYEKNGYIKADLNGIGDWNAVWAHTSVRDPYTELVSRIKRALRGDQ
jgi:hypothetical protein